MPERERRAIDPIRDQDQRLEEPLQKVSIYNDEISMDLVIRSLREICDLPHERAIRLMLNAHFTGSQVVFVGLEEDAERVRTELKERGLTVSADSPHRRAGEMLD